MLLSVGEALWSPRLYEYTVIVAPDYEEGTFMAFSHMPTFLATFISGPMSGALLQNFCPAKGPLHCETMWLIIGQRVGWLVAVVLARVKDERTSEATPRPLTCNDPPHRLV